MANEVRAFIGKGQIYLRRLDLKKGLLPIGEASAFQMNITTDEKTLPSHTTRGGGTAATAYSVSDLALAITGHSFTDENIAMALFGDVSAVSGKEVTDEALTAYSGALVPFNEIPDTEKTITVKDDTGTTTYTKGTDYDVTSSGIRILAGSTIANEDEIKVSYTSKNHSLIQLLTNSGYEYELFFEGFNDADNGNEVNVRIHRCKFSPTSNLGLIQDDFAELPIEGQALIDTTKTGAGLSKYATISRV